MELNKFFNPAPKIRPSLNLGCLFDIPTGRYHIGKHGESILNGGLAYFTGIGGRGNMFKSVVAHFMILRCLARYSSSQANIYDTETSLTMERLIQLSMTHPELLGCDLEDLGRILLTDNTMYTGNKWFAIFRDMVQAKLKEIKDHTGTLPFVDKNGANIKALRPTLYELDSLSMFMTDSVEAIYDKNQIGDSGANTDALRSAAAKNQMLMQIPTLTGSSHSYMVATAHLGDKHQLDQYAPDTKKLTFMGSGTTFKNVPEKFSFLTNNLYVCRKIEIFQNKATKAPEYPANPDDDLEGDTDLQRLTIQNLRAKAGPTGMPFELLISQREGVLVPESEFNYIKGFDRYGMGGHDRSYYLELAPDVAMQRTTLRTKIRDNASVRRALEITSEMCQMENLNFQQAQGLLCTPKELYDDLKAKGYDWAVLLNTRGYWIYEEDSHPQPYLSTLDLLKMRAGTYHPYWLPKK